MRSDSNIDRPDTADHTPDAGRTDHDPTRLPYDPGRVKVIACATVIEEMAPRMPPEMASEVLDFGLHLHPGELTAALQAAIDASTGFDAILLGYGLCSNAVVGLRATTAQARHPARRRLHRDLPRVPRRVPGPGAQRARHLLPHQGLDRGR